MNNYNFNVGNRLLRIIVVVSLCCLFLQGYSRSENKLIKENDNLNLIPQDKNTGVWVMRRFLRENSKDKILVSITPIALKQKGISNIFIDDHQTIKCIRKAIQEDCCSPDAALDTEGILSLSIYYFTIQLDGDAYTILIGCDSSGLRMGQYQYRWKSPRLSKVLHGIFEKAGWLKGDIGEQLSEALNSMVTGGNFSDEKQAARKGEKEGGKGKKSEKDEEPNE